MSPNPPSPTNSGLPINGGQPINSAGTGDVVVDPTPRFRLGMTLVQQVDKTGNQIATAMRGRPGPDRLFYTLSEIGNHSALWHGINLIEATVGGPQRRRRALRRSVILGVEQGLINGPVKWMVRRERPHDVVDRPHHLRTPRTSSFPSGHASAAACAATLLTRDHGVSWLWWTLAMGVGWSRVHVGVHHPTDVLAGMAIGRVFGGVTDTLLPTRTSPK